MKQWNGLLKKEWVTMKWALLVSALFAVFTMSFIPIIITRFVGLEVHIFEVALVICFIWASASSLAPVTALFAMLEREMKRPDVWLHSNASIFKLIGSKVFFATLIGIGGLLIPTMVLAVQYALFKSTIATFDELLFFGCIFVVVLFVTSISIMCTGFFFWVLYRLMLPYIRGFSIPLTIILFFYALWVFGRIGSFDMYNKMVKVGPIDLLQIKNPKLDVGNFYFELTGTIFYTGEIVFNILFTITIFIVATVLFEKKVRL